MTLSAGIVSTTISPGKTPFGLIERAVTQMHLAQALVQIQWARLDNLATKDFFWD